MNKTAIEYLDLTWNPLAMRCTPISEGCAHCWHLRMADRLAKNPKLPDEERAAYAGEGPPVLKQRELEAPLRRKKPAVIGLQLMGDVFHNDVSEEQIVSILHVIMTARQHTFLSLTKRPERMVALANCLFKWPENLWPSVTVEDQDVMWRIEELLKIPVAKHWVSFEPLLSAIDIDQLKHYLHGCPEPDGGGVHYVTREMALDACCPEMEGMEIVEEPDWIQTTPPIAGIVVGGESGPKARPPHPDWIRDIRDACVEVGVAFTMKQHGEWLHDSQLDQHTKDNFGGVPTGFAELAAMKVRQDQRSYIWPDGSKSYWLGKKATGRLLDGKVWDEWPWKFLGRD